MASDVGVQNKVSLSPAASEPAKAAKDVVVPAKAAVASKNEPAKTELAKAEPAKSELAKSAPIAQKVLAPAPAKAKAKAVKAKPAVAAKAKPEKPAAPKAGSLPSVSAMAQPVEAFRGVAEQSLVQARTAFAKSQEATQCLAQGFEASGQVVQSGLKEMQLRMAEAVEAQTHAALNYFKAISKTHSLSEWIDVQSIEMRQGMQRTLGEAREMSSLAQAIAAKAAEPVRKAIDLAVDTARHHH
jgi:hypothetical protein